MADANPVTKRVAKPEPKDSVGSESKPKKIDSWSEMLDPETGKKMKGSFKLGDTVITNS